MKKNDDNLFSLIFQLIILIPICYFLLKLFFSVLSQI